MRITMLVFVSLSAALPGGCMLSTLDCDPPRERFTIDAALSEAEIGELMQEWQVDARTQITCQQACQFAYLRERGWETGPLSACQWLVEREPGDAPDEQVAVVTCAGDGYEHLCEG